MTGCGWTSRSSCSIIGQPAEAEAILADGPDSAAGHHLRGLAQAELEQFPAAIGSFQPAVALNPEAAASWSNLGMMLKVEGRFDEAIAAHDRAVALDAGQSTGFGSTARSRC